MTAVLRIEWDEEGERVSVQGVDLSPKFLILAAAVLGSELAKTLAATPCGCPVCAAAQRLLQHLPASAAFEQAAASRAVKH